MIFKSYISEDHYEKQKKAQRNALGLRGFYFPRTYLGEEAVDPPPLIDLEGFNIDPCFWPVFNGMTFEGQIRKLSDTFRIGVGGRGAKLFFMCGEKLPP